MGGFSYTDFTTLPGFTLLGDAAINVSNGIDSTKVLRLTPASTWKEGGAAYGSVVPLYKFTATIKFRFTGGGGSQAPGGSSGGDGISLLLHNDTIGTGDTAGCFWQFQADPSVGFEVDTWKNEALSDPNSNHIGITLHGCVASIETATVNPKPNDGNLRTIVIDYDDGHVDISVDSSVLISRDIDLVSELDGRFSAMTLVGATGGAYQNHDIIEFSLVYDDWPQPANAIMFSCNT